MDTKRIVDQLDKMDQRLDNIDITLVRNTAQLEEHMRRTEILEQEFKPVKRHVETINLLAKIASGAGALALFFKQLGLF